MKIMQLYIEQPRTVHSNTELLQTLWIDCLPLSIDYLHNKLGNNRSVDIQACLSAPRQTIKQRKRYKVSSDELGKNSTDLRLHVFPSVSFICAVSSKGA